jgi:glycosyltransferase involved in cell wall biosynthesis
MDRELQCDFYIGDRVATPIMPMKVETLKGFRKTLKFIPLGGDFYWQKGALKVAFKSYKYYIVDGEPYCLSNWLILLITWLRGKKSLLWSHGWYGDENRVKRIVKKLFFNLADTVLLYGDYARNLMIAEGFDPRKLVCIYNSMDYDQQLKVRNSLTGATLYATHFSNPDPVLLYIGRIHRGKKIDLLIEAVKELNNSGKQCNLAIIGEEIEETGIRWVVSGYGMNDRVWFVGPLFDEDRLGEFIYHADVCVSPGNVGLTAIHSLTYGTPVITHNHFPRQGPEFEAITPGVTGDFFHENSVEDLCKKITHWLSLPPGQRASTRQACYATIEAKYNPRYQVAVLKTLLNY